MLLVCPLQLVGQLLVLLLKSSKNLLSIRSGVGLSINFIVSIPDLLLSYKNLLSDLHDNSKMVKYIHMNKYAY